MRRASCMYEEQAEHATIANITTTVTTVTEKEGRKLHTDKGKILKGLA